MRKRMNLFMRFSCLLMLVFATSSIQAQDRLYADEFPLGDVTLLDGPLKKARDLNIRVLMQYDPRPEYPCTDAVRERPSVGTLS